MSETEESFYRRRLRELVTTLEVFADRLRCEAITLHGARCTFRPWLARDGHPVCTQHHRAKSVRFT